ncbi:hypothetical protein, partial [Paraburkholderia tuberum]|uniref:hypothetical protein n=1 Tax=Paraburkholderia tuberum TaxID=157910 RepID=UPI001ABCF87A
SVTVMSIKSKMMGTTLMSLLAVVYDGRREVLTHRLDLRAHDVGAPLPQHAWTIDAPQGLRMFKVFSFSIPRMIHSGGPR